MKSTAEMIVDSAFCHLATGMQYDLQRVVSSGSVINAKQKLECHRRREFRSAAKAAIDCVIVFDDAAVRRFQQIHGQ